MGAVPAYSECGANLWPVSHQITSELPSATPSCCQLQLHVGGQCHWGSPEMGSPLHGSPVREGRQPWTEVTRPSAGVCTVGAWPDSPLSQGEQGALGLQHAAPILRHSDNGPAGFRGHADLFLIPGDQTGKGDHGD